MLKEWDHSRISNFQLSEKEGSRVCPSLTGKHQGRKLDDTGVFKCVLWKGPGFVLAEKLLWTCR